jgi:uncharacterized protein YceH (UPF0502 family)
MSFTLSPEEIRVLGVLIEKDMATPEYYPMSMNALLNGCNQKSNRDPVASYPEQVVNETLDSLRSLQLVSVLTGGSNRVPKYGHRASEILNLSNREMAVLCVLMLRGAQTLNEIKTRTESLYRFDDAESVELVLNRLAERGMTVLLPKGAGMREPRWTHLLMGEPVQPAAAAGPAEHSAGLAGPLSERVAALEAEVASLKQQLEEFRRQFQ